MRYCSSERKWHIFHPTNGCIFLREQKDMAWRIVWVCLSVCPCLVTQDETAGATPSWPLRKYPYRKRMRKRTPKRVVFSRRRRWFFLIWCFRRLVTVLLHNGGSSETHTSEKWNLLLTPQIFDMMTLFPKTALRKNMEVIKKVTFCQVLKNIGFPIKRKLIGSNFVLVRI
jgi:hypothetical protein